MGTADRRKASMTALASVSRLNHGLPTFRRLGAISRILNSGLSSFITASKFGAITDMAGLAAGSTRSRMTNSDFQPLADVRFRVIE
jgi:hypothetical protein